VIFFSFISACPARCYDPTQIISKHANDCDFSVIEESEDQVPYFAFPIGSVNNSWPIEDEAQLIEVDSPFAQDSIALVVVPTKCANLRKKTAELVSHAVCSKEKR
jgi:hypothetical protein